MSIGFSTDLRTARAQVMVDFIDAGSGPNGYIEFYGDGSGQPATGEPVTDQTLIGMLTLTKPCGSVANGQITFNLINDDLSADATANIEWARFYNSDGDFVIDCSCGDALSVGATIVFNNVSAIQGGTIRILSGTITEGNQ